MIRRPRSESRELHPSVIWCCAQLNTHLKKLAGWLQHRLDRVSLKTQKYLLLSFCVVCLAGNVFSILHSLRNPISLQPAPIQVLRLQSPEQKVTSDAYQELSRLYYLRQVLDSLVRSKISKQQADRFFKARPQLPDTLRHLDSLFTEP